VTGKGFNVKIGDRRAGDPSTLIASSDKAKRVLGWNPQKTDIRQIIKDAWNWHESHPNGYDDRR